MNNVNHIKFFLNVKEKKKDLLEIFGITEETI